MALVKRAYRRSGREALGIFDMVGGHFDRARVDRRKERLCKRDFSHGS